MHRISVAALALATLWVLSGCATLVNDPNIPIGVSFSDGSPGQCTFRNKRGTWESPIPTGGVMIRRSDDALHYVCSTADGREAQGSIRSEIEAEKFGASVLFLDLGITDAITDKHRRYADFVVIPIAPQAAATAETEQTEAAAEASDATETEPASTTI